MLAMFFGKFKIFENLTFYLRVLLSALCAKIIRAMQKFSIVYVLSRNLTTLWAAPRLPSG